MNDRIRELANQAWDHAQWNSQDGDGRHGSLYRDKLAELIIRECTDVARQYDEPKMSGPGMIIANRIEEHFGIEE